MAAELGARRCCCALLVGAELAILVLLLVIGMGRGGERNFPGGNRTGPKLKMDEVSVANRMKRKESEERTALRKAAAAAAAVEKKQAEQQRASLREKLAEQPMCVRRQLGSQRIADKATAVAAAPAAAAATAAAAQPQKRTLDDFFSKPSAPAPEA